jgi:hypothetical protein
MADTERTRVVVVDDHTVVRLGICTMLLAADDLVQVGFGFLLMREAMDLRERAATTDAR